MNIAPLRAFETLDALALKLGTTRAELDRMCDPAVQDELYVSFPVPKRGRGSKARTRTVHAVDTPLRDAHRAIEAELSKVALPERVQGFVKGRSIFTNARRHIDRGNSNQSTSVPKYGPAFVAHCDVGSFFDEIHTTSVRQAFVALGCKMEVADVLSRLCTYKDRLPQGAKTSPMLANLVCDVSGFDAALERLASSFDAVYSRYADDLVFSGPSVPERDLVDEIFRRHGFRMREDSWRVQRRGRRQTVTSLGIDGPQPRVSRQLKRRLRLFLHHAKRDGIDEQVVHARRWRCSGFGSLQEVHGLIAFVHAIEPRLAQKFWAELEVARAESVRRARAT